MRKFSISGKVPQWTIGHLGVDNHRWLFAEFLIRPKNPNPILPIFTQWSRWYLGLRGNKNRETPQSHLWW